MGHFQIPSNYRIVADGNGEHWIEHKVSCYKVFLWMFPYGKEERWTKLMEARACYDGTEYWEERFKSAEEACKYLREFVEKEERLKQYEVNRHIKHVVEC